MKWFQHHSDTHINLKLQKLCRIFGMEGYGFWWLSCELVAHQGIEYCVSKDRDWKDWLEIQSKLSREKIDTLLEKMAEFGLIDPKEFEKGNLFMPKMTEYSDDYTNRVRRVSEQGSDSVRQDKIRLDKIRLDKKESKENRFTPPSIEEVKKYCLERKNEINPGAFIDFYSSKGWLIGKNKMKDWKAAIRTWENRNAPKVNSALKEKYKNI